MSCEVCGTEYPYRDDILDFCRNNSGGTAHDESEQWDSQADKYEVRRSADALYMASVAAAVRSLGSVAGLTTLDAGCGTGMTTLPLASRGATVIALDLSFASLAALKRKVGAENIRAIRGDITRLPFASASFDCVISANTIQQIPDESSRYQAVSELAHVTRPGGRVIVSVHSYSVRKRMLGWLKKGPAGGHSGSVRYVHRFVPNEFHRLLDSSLRVERITGCAFSLPYYWKMTAISRCVEFVLSRTSLAATGGEMLIGHCVKS